MKTDVHFSDAGGFGKIVTNCIGAMAAVHACDGEHDLAGGRDADFTGGSGRVFCLSRPVSGWKAAPIMAFSVESVSDMAGLAELVSDMALSAESVADAVFAG
jgi:hypothetical protein